MNGTHADGVLPSALLLHDCESELLLLRIVDACERTSIGFASTMAEIASCIALNPSSAFTNCDNF